MREFLEDAYQHREDGYGRAQHLNKVELPKRFYKEVGVGSGAGGYCVTLDGKTPRTPGAGAGEWCRNQPLAAAMAAEWAAQRRVHRPQDHADASG